MKISSEGSFSGRWNIKSTCTSKDFQLKYKKIRVLKMERGLPLRA
jgi:hypothetical protein